VLCRAYIFTNFAYHICYILSVNSVNETNSFLHLFGVDLLEDSNNIINMEWVDVAVKLQFWKCSFRNSVETPAILMFFVVFLSSSMQIPGYSLIRSPSLHSKSCQSIIHLSCCHLTLLTVCKITSNKKKIGSVVTARPIGSRGCEMEWSLKFWWIDYTSTSVSFCVSHGRSTNQPWLLNMLRIEWNRNIYALN
jgi:hypothetical protein